MPEGSPARLLLAFNDTSGTFLRPDTRKRSGSRLLPFALITAAITAAAVTAAYLYYRYNQGPYFVPYDPTDPQYDVYGRPIHHQIQPPPVGENETKMSAEEDSRYQRALELEAEADKVLRRTNPLAFYWKHYPFMPRGQLREIDPALYKSLSRMHMLDGFGSQRGIPSTQDLELLGTSDPLRVAQSRYPGFNQWQLQDANPELCDALRRSGQWRYIPN